MYSFSQPAVTFSQSAAYVSPQPQCTLTLADGSTVPLSYEVALRMLAAQSQINVAHPPNFVQPVGHYAPLSQSHNHPQVVLQQPSYLQPHPQLQHPHSHPQLSVEASVPQHQNLGVMPMDMSGETQPQQAQLQAHPPALQQPQQAPKENPKKKSWGDSPLPSVEAITKDYAAIAKGSDAPKTAYANNQHTINTTVPRMMGLPKIGVSKKNVVAHAHTQKKDVTDPSKIAFVKGTFRVEIVDGKAQTQPIWKAIMQELSDLKFKGVKLFVKAFDNGNFCATLTFQDQQQRDDFLNCDIQFIPIDTEEYCLDVDVEVERAFTEEERAAHKQSRETRQSLHNQQHTQSHTQQQVSDDQRRYIKILASFEMDAKSEYVRDEVMQQLLNREKVTSNIYVSCPKKTNEDGETFYGDWYAILTFKTVEGAEEFDKSCPDTIRFGEDIFEVEVKPYITNTRKQDE